MWISTCLHDLCTHFLQTFVQNAPWSVNSSTLHKIINSTLSNILYTLICFILLHRIYHYLNLQYIYFLSVSLQYSISSMRAGFFFSFFRFVYCYNPSHFDKGIENMFKYLLRARRRMELRNQWPQCFLCLERQKSKFKL